MRIYTHNGPSCLDRDVIASEHIQCNSSFQVHSTVLYMTDMRHNSERGT